MKFNHRVHRDSCFVYTSPITPMNTQRSQSYTLPQQKDADADMVRYPLPAFRYPQKNKSLKRLAVSGKPRAEFVHKDHKEKE